jgi:hypothetical protein
MPRGFSFSALDRNSNPGTARGKQLRALFVAITQWENRHFLMRKGAHSPRRSAIALAHDVR